MSRQNHRRIRGLWTGFTHTNLTLQSILILGELRFGILILPTGKKRTALERWFDAGAGRLHCLPWDADTGLIWAELLARLRKTGKTMPIKDSLIAATAMVHSLAVATRNRIDFAKAGVHVVDPFVR